MALSIGSYVCQARAAGRLTRRCGTSCCPLVRGDVDDADSSTAATSAATGDVGQRRHGHYIRIATERLC